MTKLKDLQFTPEPWEIQTKEQFIHTDENYHCIVANGGPSSYGRGFTLTACIDINDAKLISHAPKMLELLKSAEKTLLEYISVRGIDRDEDDLKQLLTEINNLLNS